MSKENLVTLTPEIKGEFDIQLTNGIIDGTFKAKILVKIGEVEDYIFIYRERKYVPDEDRKKYNLDTHEMYRNVTSIWKGRYEREYPFKKFENVGIKLNWKPLIEKYDIERKEWKKTRKEQVIEQRNFDWKNSWAHKFISDFEVTHKKLKPYEYTIGIYPLQEDYVKEAEKIHICIEYLDQKVCVYNLSVGELGHKKYSWKHTVSNDKWKRSINPTLIVLKFLEMVDQHIIQTEAKKKRINDVEQARVDKCVRLTELFEMKVLIKEKWEGKSIYRNGRTDGQYVYRYYVEIPQFKKPTTEEQMKNDLFGSKKEEKKNPLQYEINENINSYNRNPNTFDFAGLINLTVTQMKTILSVL